MIKKNGLTPFRLSCHFKRNAAGDLLRGGLESGKKNREARLFKMVVASESLRDAFISHHPERDAVGQGSLLVGARGEQFETTIHL